MSWRPKQQGWLVGAGIREEKADVWRNLPQSHLPESLECQAKVRVQLQMHWFWKAWEGQHGLDTDSALQNGVARIARLLPSSAAATILHSPTLPGVLEITLVQ